MFLLLISLIACNNGEEGISSKKAEEIATEQLEQDIQKFNEDKNKKIKIDDIELLQNETVFSSDNRTWEVHFNYKSSTDEPLQSSVAHYSVDLKGNIKRTTLSF